MGNRIVGMRGNRRLERGARFFVLPALRPDHRQIVVWLGQLRKIFGQRLEGGDRLVGLVLVGLDDAAQEARLWILGVCRERGIDLDSRGRIFSFLDHAGRLRQIGRETWSRGGYGLRCRRRRWGSLLRERDASEQQRNDNDGTDKHLE